MPKKRQPKKVNKENMKVNQESVKLLIEATKKDIEFLNREKELKLRYLDMIQQPHALDVMNAKWEFELTREYKQQFIDEVKLSVDRFLAEYDLKMNDLLSKLKQFESLLSGDNND